MERTDMRKRYAEYVESETFKSSYAGKSLGDVIPIDDNKDKEEENGEY